MGSGIPFGNTTRMATNSPQGKMNSRDQLRINDFMPAFDYSMIPEDVVVNRDTAIDFDNDLSKFMVDRQMMKNLALETSHFNSIKSFAKQIYLSITLLLLLNH